MRAVQSPIIPVVAELIRAHPGTISLGQGVVSYGPPQQAIDQITTFLADPENHKYKPVHGIPALLQAIEHKLATENNIALSAAHRLLVTAGGNMAFVNALLAVADPGDEIIILAPYYFNHEMAITMASCRPVAVPTDENYQPRLDVIAGAITLRTRAIVTVSPNNPSGAVYPESTLRAVNRLCRENDLYHIHDEAYEYFTWDSARHFSPASLPDTADHTISLFSLSKSFGFASWRVGYMVIPAFLFDAIRKIQDTVLICPPVISQYAAIGALAAGVAYCREKLTAMAEVRAIVAEHLDSLRNLCTIPPADGAFYFFLKMHTQMDSMQLVECLIREHGVAVIPGTTFGMNDACHPAKSHIAPPTVGRTFLSAIPDNPSTMNDACHLRLSYGPLNKETAAVGISRFVRGIEAIVRR
jgi:aspartate/methionine/tyrosine aminotransferase